MSKASNDSVKPLPLPSEITGSRKIRALLMARGLTVSEWAQRHGVPSDQARQMTNAVRKRPGLRNLLAADLGLTRAEIDLIIDGPAAEGPQIDLVPADEDAA